MRIICDAPRQTCNRLWIYVASIAQHIVDKMANIIENLSKAILNPYEHPKKQATIAKVSLERSKLFNKETCTKNFFAALEDN